MTLLQRQQRIAKGLNACRLDGWLSVNVNLFIIECLIRGSPELVSMIPCRCERLAMMTLSVLFSSEAPPSNSIELRI